MHGQERLLPDGLGRQRPADRAPRAELLRRPLRPVPAVRRRLHAPGEAGPQEAGPDQPAQLRRAVRAARRGGREGLRVAVAHPRPLRRLVGELHDHRRQVPDGQPDARSCATSPAARPTSRRRRRSGTSPSRPPSRRPSSRRATTPGAYHRVAFHRPGRRAGPHRDDPSRADPQRRRADRAPRRRALPAAVRHHGHLARSSASRSRCSPTPPAEPDKGAGIAMCCTFGDLTDVMWWRELDLPVRTLIGRDGRMLRETPEWLSGDRAAAAYEELKGKTTFSAREAVVAALRESGDLDGEPKPTQRMANFYEKGDKPLEIVATRQWYIRNGGRDADAPRRDARARRRDPVDPRPHEAPLRQLGRRPQRRLADLAASASSASRSRSGTPSTTPATPTTTTRCSPARRSCRSTRRRRPRAATTRPSAASPAASSATPTSWTPGRPRR